VDINLFCPEESSNFAGRITCIEDDDADDDDDDDDNNNNNNNNNNLSST